MKDLTVVIPIYKEDAMVVTRLYDSLVSLGCQVIVVNDGNTVPLDPRINTVSYTPQRGYGYALKEGIKKATTPVICTMDGDGQHTSDDIWRIWTIYNMLPNCSMVVGSRWNLKEPPIRWFGRKSLNFIGSIISKHYLSDLNSGMRVFKRELAVAYMPILCNEFSFTTCLTMSMVTDGYQVVWIPIEVEERKYGSSKVQLVRHGLMTLYYIFRIGLALRTRGIRKWKRDLLGQ